MLALCVLSGIYPRRTSCFSLIGADVTREVGTSDLLLGVTVLRDIELSDPSLLLEAAVSDER
jgi:hypothetical protein